MLAVVLCIAGVVYNVNNGAYKAKNTKSTYDAQKLLNVGYTAVKKDGQKKYKVFM